MKYRYFNYDPVGPSIFFYTAEDGSPKEINFNIEDPEHLVEAVSAIINSTNIDHVLCNQAGLGLSDSIKSYLMTQYNARSCEFELNT